MILCPFCAASTGSLSPAALVESASMKYGFCHSLGNQTSNTDYWWLRSLLTRIKLRFHLLSLHSPDGNINSGGNWKPLGRKKLCLSVLILVIQSLWGAI